MNAFIDTGPSEIPDGFYQGPIAHMMVVAHFVENFTREKLLQVQPDKRLNSDFEGYISLLAERDYAPGKLAARLGIRKQACSKAITQLVTLGLIERRTNPEDSRSSLLSLTAEGLQLRRDSIAVSEEIYQQFGPETGGASLQQLVEILAKLHRNLGTEGAGYCALEPATRSADRRSTSLNLLLPGLVSYFRRALMTSLTDKGFEGLKFSFSPLLGMLNREARKIQYIASVIGVSKQAIAVTAADLEQAGYITRDPDPSDKRQIILSLTPRGRLLLNESVASVRSIEASMKDLLGDADYRLMDDTLAAMYLQVAEHYDIARVLPAKIQQISEYLLAELGVAGVRLLTDHLMTMTRGKP